MKSTDFAQLKRHLAELQPRQGHDDAPFKWGSMNGRQRYRCRACKKTFTSLTATVTKLILS